MGYRLAKIFGSLGHTIILGSRDSKKAEDAANVIVRFSFTCRN